MNPIDTIHVLMTSIYSNRFNIEKEGKFDLFIEEVINDSLKLPTFQETYFEKNILLKKKKQYRNKFHIY